MSDLDHELAHIEARYAADKRVLDAAEALVQRMRVAVGDDILSASQWLDPDSYALFAAVDARRALTGAGPEVVVTRPDEPCSFCAVTGGHTAVCAVSTGRYE